MTDDEKKAWEEMVGGAKKRMLVDMQMTRASYIQDRVILAADRELTALHSRCERLEKVAEALKAVADSYHFSEFMRVHSPEERDHKFAEDVPEYGRDCDEIHSVTVKVQAALDAAKEVEVMKTRPFSELRNKMSPEARKEVCRRVADAKVEIYREGQNANTASAECILPCSSSAPCPHEAEAKRLREAGEGVARIATERVRQKSTEGWTPEHDAQHTSGELSIAAACYALNKMPVYSDHWWDEIREWWPWHPDWDKREKHDRERSLEIAGALIAAELDRLDELRRRAKEG